MMSTHNSDLKKLLNVTNTDRQATSMLEQRTSNSSSEQQSHWINHFINTNTRLLTSLTGGKTVMEEDLKSLNLDPKCDKYFIQCLAKSYDFNIVLMSECNCCNVL